MEEYFLAGRNLPFWALSLTFVASWWGAGAALVCADEAYREGLGAFWVQGMPVIFSTFLLLLMSRLVRRVGSFTQSQMLRTRYGGATAPLLTAVLILGFMIITAASQVVGIGLFLSTYLNTVEIISLFSTFLAPYHFYLPSSSSAKSEIILEPHHFPS